MMLNNASKKNFSYCRAGFTLVETLLAVALLSMFVVVPLGVASRGVTVSTLGKDRVIAISLARDAIEYVRSIRDYNRTLNNDDNPNNNVTSWLDGLTLYCIDALGCLVDSTAMSNNITDRTSASGGLLNFDSSSKLYGYTNTGGWSNSKFTRFVVIQERAIVGGGSEALVTATVTWPTNFVTKSVVITNQLMSW